MTTTTALLALTGFEVSGLPALFVRCPHCSTEKYAAAVRESHDEMQKWQDAESAAYDAWYREHPWADTDRWRRSLAYAELGPRPDVLSEGCCVECDWKGIVLTPAGRAILALLDTFRSGE